jgi:heptosyltransferase-2
MIVKKILIFNPSFIGDTILTTPLLKVCKDYFDNPIIHYCVRFGYEKLFMGLPFIDKVILFDKRGKDRGVKGILKLRKYLKEELYDIIICPHRSIRSSLIVNLAKAKATIGFGDSVFSFLHKKKVVRDLQIHEVYRNLQLLKPIIGNNYENIIKDISSLYVAKNKEYAFTFKSFINVIKGNYTLAGIQATSNWKTKMWPSERFVALINKLYEYNIISVLFSSLNELDTISHMTQYIKVPFINMAGLLSLDELSSVIANLDLFITNDTGPMHIAAAHKVPVVAIFGPTIPQFGFTPFGCKYKIVEDTALYCRPCSLHGGIKCPEKHFKCMLNISMESVLKYVIELINK